MGRRKSKLSTLSIFHWFCSNIAIALGIAPQSQRKRRVATKRCNRIVTYTRQKDFNEFNNISRPSGTLELSILHNNNNRSLDSLAYGDIKVNTLSNGDQQQILCILVENAKIVEYIQQLLSKHASIIKDSRIIDLHELVQLIQSTTMNATHEDASTMTNTDQTCRQTASCASFITQSENARRLKALEFIRIFIENTKEDFCKYLINEEHLCQQKTLAIYQMIKQFLKGVYQSEHVQKLKSL